MVYDLVKRKAHRVYDTAAVTSLAWIHSGDYVYAGTRQGDVLIGHFDKQLCAPVWNSSAVERRDEGDDSEKIIIIRRVDWLPSQNPGTSYQGCLFVLLGAFGDESADSLQSVLIGLGAESAGSGDKLSEIMCIPPLNMEDVVGFRVVPSVDKSKGKRPGGGDAIIPAILMVTQRTSQDGKVLRQLKALRCSSAPDMRDWALEIGSLADPRCATEVLPGGSSQVTVSTDYALIYTYTGIYLPSLLYTVYCRIAALAAQLPELHPAGGGPGRGERGGDAPEEFERELPGGGGQGRGSPVPRHSHLHLLHPDRGP